MDIWSVANPFFRILLYLSSFGAIGTILFTLHFGKYQSLTGKRYCKILVNKSAILGVVVSLVSFLLLAGNIGGDIASTFEPIMLQLAFESKGGNALLVALSGFVLLVITNRIVPRASFIPSLFGAALVLFSFAMIGHSTKEGLATQSLLLIHLVGIAYWLGSLMPFRWMCMVDSEENLHFIAHRFGVLAIRYIGVLLIAGITFACNLLGSFSALINTSYGNVLVVKLMAVFLIILLGALNKFRLVPLLVENVGVGAKRLRSSVNFELVLASFILVLSSLLTTSITLPIRM